MSLLILNKMSCPWNTDEIFSSHMLYSECRFGMNARSFRLGRAFGNILK